MDCLIDREMKKGSEQYKSKGMACAVLKEPKRKLGNPLISNLPYSVYSLFPLQRCPAAAAAPGPRLLKEPLYMDLRSR